MVILIVFINMVSIEYVPTSKRKIPKMSNALQTEWFEYLQKNNPFTVEDLINLSNKWVAGKLEYDYNVASFDPDDAVRKGKVNCTGYAALQTAAINEGLKQFHDGEKFYAEWHCGKVLINGIKATNFKFLLGSMWSSWKGGHCYTVVYKKGSNDRIYPDANFYDMFSIGYLADSERRAK